MIPRASLLKLILLNLPFERIISILQAKQELLSVHYTDPSFNIKFPILEPLYPDVPILDSLWSVIRHIEITESTEGGIFRIWTRSLLPSLVYFLILYGTNKIFTKVYPNINNNKKLLTWITKTILTYPLRYIIDKMNTDVIDTIKYRHTQDFHPPLYASCKPGFCLSSAKYTNLIKFYDTRINSYRFPTCKSVLLDAWVSGRLTNNNFISIPYTRVTGYFSFLRYIYCGLFLKLISDAIYKLIKSSALQLYFWIPFEVHSLKTISLCSTILSMMAVYPINALRLRIVVTNTWQRVDYLERGREDIDIECETYGCHCTNGRECDGKCGVDCHNAHFHKQYNNDGKFTKRINQLWPGGAGENNLKGLANAWTMARAINEQEGGLSLYSGVSSAILQELLRGSIV
ncbi:uncharacterized protein SAPINGB_P000477 [Magnusiomyces paraingens]|uniref:Uncharacterized protein n=1 Tax=Magnusiomyces paraingens TaxID=2606893 RepID=A0A5E8B707_9ASCO|nr:uncharacterized protein SAPINGB_P000477 [Saprochaete ingens]VVT44621.1 unnamed protein product [Saprochaete ingens]